MRITLDLDSSSSRVTDTTGTDYRNLTDHGSQHLYIIQEKSGLLAVP